MTRRDEYDETPDPAQVYLQLQRERAAQRNFVTPAPLATRQPQTIDQVAQWAMQAQPLDVAQAWQPLPAAKESTSAVDRARGLQLRLAPFVVSLGQIAFGLGKITADGVFIEQLEFEPAHFLPEIDHHDLGDVDHGQLLLRWHAWWRPHVPPYATGRGAALVRG